MLLDPTIRDWVLIPLLCLVVAIHYLRSSVMRLVQPAPVASLVETSQKNLLGRSARLRTNGGFITPKGFAMRKDYFIDPVAGRLTADSVEDKPQNPMMQTDGMKGQLSNMVLGYGPMMWISSVLTGFLLVKVPFPLANRFKTMTQQGIALPDLNPSYVSAMSMFMIAQMAMPKVLSLLQRRAASPEMAEAEAKMSAAAMQSMGMPMAGMTPGMGQGPAGFMAKTAFKAEASALGIVTYDAAEMASAEKALLEEGRAVLRSRRTRRNSEAGAAR